jgi:GT2 family glycosyltransferase
MSETGNRIAIVVPSHARPEALRACLEALARQEGGPYRTYVVDDGSPEGLAPLCAAYPWVTCLRQENAGPAAARNAGARAALRDGADFLCFTDDDCRPHPEWVRGLAARQGGDPRRLVGGRVLNLLDDNAYAAASQSLCDYLYAYFGAEEGRAAFFTSNNLGCAAAGFAALNGFDSTFPLAAAEDRDFCLRWQEEVGTLAYAPGAVVDHAHPLTLGRFWRQHANYGRGARHLHRTLAARGAPHPRREPVGFYAGLLLYPLRDGQGFPLHRTALMGLSQVAMVAGYMQERRTEGAAPPLTARP